jgi:hypothetical protein
VATNVEATRRAGLTAIQFTDAPALRATLQQVGVL